MKYLNLLDVTCKVNDIDTSTVFTKLLVQEVYLNRNDRSTFVDIIKDNIYLFYFKVTTVNMGHQRNVKYKLSLLQYKISFI